MVFSSPRHLMVAGGCIIVMEIVYKMDFSLPGFLICSIILGFGMHNKSLFVVLSATLLFLFYLYSLFSCFISEKSYAMLQKLKPSLNIPSKLDTVKVHKGVYHPLLFYGTP